MNADFTHEAAEHALAASMKDFQDQVAACGHDLQAPAISLTWKQVADEVFKYLIEKGINPLQISKEDLQYFLGEVEESLDCTVAEGWWTDLLFPMVITAIQKTERPVEEGHPDGRDYASDHTSETANLLAHPRDCRCPECEGEAPEESRLDRTEDSHLEAQYEDRVSGCDWDF